MSDRIYADYNASAPIRPEARAAVGAALERCGNPSSAHREGAQARRLIEGARENVAALVGRHPRDVVFTSGATEANATVLAGLLTPGDRLLTSPIEHASILAPARQASANGVRVDMLSVQEDGRLTVDGQAPQTATLVSLCLANGEVGSVVSDQMLDLLARATRWMHLDVTQAVARLPLPAGDETILSLSAHKLGAIAGVGALILPPSAPLRALVTGGDQERGRRAGTENLAGIAAFGAVAKGLASDWQAEAQRVRLLRDALWAGLKTIVPGIVRNGPPLTDGLPNTLNVQVPGISGDALLVRLDLEGIAASLGSACAAGSPEPSHVLRAMGRDETAARGGLRLSLGWASTESDVRRIVRVIAEIVRERVADSAA